MALNRMEWSLLHNIRGKYLVLENRTSNIKTRLGRKKTRLGRKKLDLSRLFEVVFLKNAT